MEINNNLPWVEKYRPTNINNIYEQNEIILTLNKSDKYNFTLPHCLFYGPPGTGKTTTALAICLQLFGKKNFKERILELNASDERGIKVVREKIKTFAKLKIKMNQNKLPNYKVIILDEADALTDESQFALRRIIEENSSTTRFFFICNYVTKINKAIISRCAVYRFKPLSNSTILNMLVSICNSEDIKVNKRNLNELVNYCNGDLRKAINTLQRYQFLNYFDNIDSVIFKISSDAFVKILNKLKSVSNYIELLDIVKIFVKNSYGGNNILKEFNVNVINCDILSDGQKSLILFKISELDNLLNNRSNEELIIINMLSYISYVLHI